MSEGLAAAASGVGLGCGMSRGTSVCGVGELLPGTFISTSTGRVIRSIRKTTSVARESHSKEDGDGALKDDQDAIWDCQVVGVLRGVSQVFLHFVTLLKRWSCSRLFCC